ncbi:methyl-accepting chemotaxis protein [Brevundimonas subvibrioides]|uniref:Methyl-accepting chemotaxis sensory transducer n=1 Tax=Brevundimonas subvibrioides (strain ATCC 15264 / DSM 4735 / LMG 14903 / NBRC 16000 / CB 81) TaxID=633149 RepID=D9QHE1_BRESC|nr:methyl-accepting chemotaxis protein [Brevundimonas subvibrioides]ADL01107.1 methyl-accepting chemotaxis sensory transducer [Brevundimonas subvibrioides ATCC 15264]
MIFQPRDLVHQRAIGAGVILGLGYVLVAVALIQALVLKSDLLSDVGPALLCAAVQTGVWFGFRDQAFGRMLSSILLMAQVSTLVAALSGHALQTDMHMAYFAALAVVVIYCDWRAIVGGAVTVALHHLILSFVLPDLVFPGSADITRVLVHAVILVVEAAVLTWSAASVTAMFAANAESQAAAELATRKAHEAADALGISRATTDRQAAEAADRERTVAHEQAMVAKQTAERDRVLAEEQAEVVEKTAAGLSALARGDLSYRITGEFPASYAKLQADFNVAIEALHADITTIDANASAISSEAAEISQAAHELSQRTETQAATLEETAAALEEVTATVRMAAQGADDASAVMERTQAEADRSRPVIEDAVNAMGDIEASSEQISQIVGVIDEIAFQTNLLALNAGVEAARAGDAGRGFAVVATEVRALAQRSAEAAKEINALITKSRDQVKNGVTLVGRTGVTLEAIAARVSDISGIMGQITASTREQATALAEINLAINQMDQATQQNAAMVEESTAACQNLTNDASQLASLVARFELGGTGRGRRAPAGRRSIERFAA